MHNTATPAHCGPPAYVADANELEELIRKLATVITRHFDERDDRAPELLRPLVEKLIRAEALPGAYGVDELGLGVSDFKDAECHVCGEWVAPSDEATEPNEAIVHASTCRS